MSENRSGSVTPLHPCGEDVRAAIARLRRVQAIAAPTFAEGERAAYVRDDLAAAPGVSEVRLDAAGNVLARLAGADGGRPPLLVTAHLDTVFPAGTDLTLREEAGVLHGPGVGDNALGVAALLTLPDLLAGAGVRPASDVLLAANVCEEGLGDLKGMRAVLEGLDGPPAGVIVLEGQGLGGVTTRGVGSRRYEVSVRAPGGHSWGDFPAAGAVHALLRLGALLAGLEVPETPKTTFNIGRIEGGTSVNTIAREASLQLDLRSEDTGALADLVARADAMVDGFAEPDCEVSRRVIGDRPAGAIDPGHPLVRLAWGVLDALEESGGRSEASSTDANIPLAMGVPAVCVGISRGGNTHRPDEYVELGPIANGLAQLLTLTAKAPEVL